MFFKREVHILDMITEHWFSYVILCNPRLLQSAGRKLVGVLKLASMLKSKGRIRELSLSSVFSHTYQTRLPAFTVKTDNIDMHVEFYIDPIETQQDRLRFHLIFCVQGIPFDQIEVVWSAKSGPDMIHAYSFLELIENMENRWLRKAEKLTAHAKLEAHLSRLRRVWGIEFQRIDDLFQIYYQGEVIGVISLLDSGGKFITNYSFNTSCSYRTLPFKPKSLDAIVL